MHGDADNENLVLAEVVCWCLMDCSIVLFFKFKDYFK